MPSKANTAAEGNAAPIYEISANVHLFQHKTSHHNLQIATSSIRRAVCFI
jgi:hypothetical protein